VVVNSCSLPQTNVFTAKGGGQPNVGTIFALSPDHGIGFSVVANTDDPVRALEERWPLRQLVGEVFVTAAEHAGHENAEINHAGIFTVLDNPNTNVTISVDPDKPGLNVESMFFEGIESRSVLAGLGSVPLPSANFSVRIYPTGVESRDGDIHELEFRAITAKIPAARTRARAEGGTSLFENRCLNFLSVAFQKGEDGVHGIDEFVLKTIRGRLQSVSYRASGITMERVG
jgi:hypothetical protein